MKTEKKTPEEIRKMTAKELGAYYASLFVASLNANAGKEKPADKKQKGK